MVGPSWRHTSRWDRRKRTQKGASMGNPSKLPISPHHLEALRLIRDYRNAEIQCIPSIAFDYSAKGGTINRYELRHHGLIIEFDADVRRIQLSPKAEAILDQ